MITNICLSVIASCVLIFTISFLLLSRTLYRATRQAEYTLYDLQDQLALLTEESIAVLNSTNQLINDLNHKAEALNIFFQPLSKLSEETYIPSYKIKQVLLQCLEVIDLVLNSVVLFKQVKGEVKRWH